MRRGIRPRPSTTVSSRDLACPAGKTFKTRRGGHVQALDDVTISIGRGVRRHRRCLPAAASRRCCAWWPDWCCPISGISRSTATGHRATKGTAMAFQPPTLLPWMNVERNVAFPLSLSGGDGPEARERARALLHSAGLAASSIGCREKLWRHAATRRDLPRPCATAAHPAHGRTIRRTRCSDARGDEVRPCSRCGRQIRWRCCS